MDPKVDLVANLDIRRLSAASTDGAARPPGTTRQLQPTTVVSAFLDAAAPRIRRDLQRYAKDRGPEDREDSWRRYRISMDLFSEFVGYVMSRRLLEAERQRVALAVAAPAP